MLQGLDGRVPCHLESAPQIIPDRDPEFGACFGEPEERIAAIPSDFASCSGADLPPRDVASDIVLRSVGVEGDFRPLQHHRQFCPIGMQPRQQAIQRGEAGAAKEDAVEPGTQRGRPAFTRFGPVNLEIGVKIPDQPAHQFLGGAMLLGEGVHFMHQPFRVNPAQRVPPDVELAGPRLRRGRLCR